MIVFKRDVVFLGVLWAMFCVPVMLCKSICRLVNFLRFYWDQQCIEIVII